MANPVFRADQPQTPCSHSTSDSSMALKATAKGAINTTRSDTGAANFLGENVPASMVTAQTIYPVNVCSINGYPGPNGTVVVNGTSHVMATGSPYSNTWSFTGTANYNNIGRTTITDTINKKPALVTPNAASKTYSDTDPALTGTLTGFLAADGITATYTRTTGETVAGSPYTISATLSSAGELGITT